jgi:hypothetical protein
VVRASSLMPVKVVDWTPLAPYINECHGAGFVERLAYQMMGHVLKTGWTPERAARFYGSISEIEHGRGRATARLLEVIMGKIRKQLASGSFTLGDQRKSEKATPHPQGQRRCPNTRL